MREKTCMFTGHRDLGGVTPSCLRRRLEAEITARIGEGTDTFLAGGALGFDLEASLTVLRLRDTASHIRLILALPCENQHKYWPKEQQDLFCRIRSRADEIHVLQPRYDPGCMMRRNRYMADRAAFCIAFLNKPSGGTFYTVMYALKRGLRVVNLAQTL